MSNQKVISTLEQVTTDWLTAVLLKSGALFSGQVMAFESKSGGGHWSKNAQLTLTYSDDAQGDRPSKLFLKMVNTDLGDDEFFLPAEVTYYARDYIDLPNAPLIRCFDAQYDAKLNRYHVLLEDVSATHKPAYDVSPTLAYGYEIADGLAMLHARWWGHERLKTIDVAFHDVIHLTEWVAANDEGIPFVKSVFADRLKSHWPQTIDEIFAKLPALLIKRAKSAKHFTFIHGDPNPGNIMVPHEGVSPLYFIDQQPFDFSITVWSGLFDLAYVMPLYWPSELRRELEIPVLKRYHTKLIEHGITNYSWDELFLDYRLAAAMMVPLAVEYMSDGGDPDWNEFRYGLVQRTLTTFDDLNCQELF